MQRLFRIRRLWLTSKNTAEGAVARAGVAQYPDFGFPAFIWRMALANSLSSAYLNLLGELCQSDLLELGTVRVEFLAPRLSFFIPPYLRGRCGFYGAPSE